MKFKYNLHLENGCRNVAIILGIILDNIKVIIRLNKHVHEALIILEDDDFLIEEYNVWEGCLVIPL